jgi:hypothetical protein
VRHLVGYPDAVSWSPEDPSPSGPRRLIAPGSASLEPLPLEAYPA